MSHGSAETRELGHRSGADASWSPAERLFNVGALVDGRYEVIRPVGRGGMGWVVEVERLDDGRRLALKYCEGSSLRGKRLVREAKILGSLRHPHLLPVLDARLDQEPPYFVMPLAAGTLEEDIRARRRGGIAWSLSVLRQVCMGVQALHWAGVTHRDLKPANVLRLEDGRYVVADLGTAKREPRDSTILTRTCAILGTLCYLAPEQLLPGGSRTADARTDVFQLGKMLYQLVTGKLPAVIEATALPPALSHIILRAVAQRPDERYPDVASLLDAIDACRWNAPSRLAGSPSDILEVLVARHQGGDDPEAVRREILHALLRLQGEPPAVVLEAIDRLPRRLLVELGERGDPAFVRALGAFARALEHAAGRRPFDYADLVVARMRAVFQASDSAEIKVAALRAILIAAVVLNRYAAMGHFKALIYGVQSSELAFLAAEMLRENRDYFQEVATHLNATRLHPAVLAVVDDLDWIDTVSF
ncbi:Serine/threonine-protein kinase StkP [Aquisphaera giovannonii]|uniref:Serine/threonine-protein kinase StkP n=1 Tax=Aquisphaera giovannonii TaxID=406548 RepID=A0A5B9VYZ5_9BACT|nr:serine/threonine-protein kinase [Aquisphaera giovannonii]QEH33596.1 Serine/threonine-protein kinase StkP [Aquisphaera giovannonii]